MSINLYDSAMVTNVRILGQCEVMREATLKKEQRP